MSARPLASLFARAPEPTTHVEQSDVLTLLPHRDREPRTELLPCYDLAGIARILHWLAARPRLEVHKLGTIDGEWVYALRLRDERPRLRIIVTAGVHGVEPAGPAAALLVAQHILAEPERLHGLDLTVLPLINPIGYARRTRGNGDHLDLNRCFFDSRRAPREVHLVRPILSSQPYDLGMDLHASRSVGERGFFALHRNATDVLRPAMERFGKRHPILRESTDQYALESDGILRSDNTGTLKDYLIGHGTRRAMTIEAPAVWPYERQVTASAEMVLTLIETARDLTLP